MKRPLIYYAVSLFLGCYSALFLTYHIVIGAVIAASFLIIILCTVDHKGFICIIYIFFALGAASFCFYNAVYVPDSIDVRVIKTDKLYSVASYRNRILLLHGKIDKKSEGHRIYAYGNFENKPQYDKGIIGEFNVNRYTEGKIDVFTKLYDVKKNIFTRFTELLGEKDSAFIMSLCFGDTEYLTKDQKSEFQKLGVIHAVSVSGMHMSLIYIILESIAGLGIAAFVSVLYVVFTGIQPSAVRALLMIFTLKISKKFMRSYDSLSALSLSAIFILILKPYYIADLGFLLSYLAALGIIIYYKKIKKFFWRLPVKLNEDISIALSAQVFSLPFILLSLGNFSPGFLIGNIILLPLYTVVMVLGNAGLLFLPLRPVFNLLGIILKYVNMIIAGAQYILLRITPDVVYFNRAEATVIFLFLACWILYKNGYKRCKYLPVFFTCLLMLQSYSPIPKIEYYYYFNNQYVILRYGNDSVLLANSARVPNIKEEYNKKITGVSEKGCRILLKDKYEINVLKTADNSLYKNCINLQINGNNLKTCFINNCTLSDMNNMKGYDIINLENPSLIYNPGSYTKEYYIVLDRIFEP